MCLRHFAEIDLISYGSKLLRNPEKCFEPNINTAQEHLLLRKEFGQIMHTQQCPSVVGHAVVLPAGTGRLLKVGTNHL